MTRPSPYELVFGRLGAERFPALRDALGVAGVDERDEDAFVLVGEVVELLRELRPDEGVGSGIDEFVAFVHAAYLFWRDGQVVVECDRPTLESLLRGPPVTTLLQPRPTYYLRLPARRVWGEPVAGQPPEPLDGSFVTVTAAGIDALAVFGVHAGRSGFTVVRAKGPRPPALDRADGTPAFAPRLEGGEAAGLFSLAGSEELIELVCRCHAVAGLTSPQSA